MFRLMRYRRREVPIVHYFIGALAVLGSCLAMAQAAAPAAASQPAKPALSSNDCTIGDYCTVLLAPKLQDALNATDDQRTEFAKEKDRFEAMLTRGASAGSHGPSAGPHGGAPSGGAAVILGAAKHILETEGQRVRDLLTDAQDTQLQRFFADGALKPIEIRAAKATNRPRAGVQAQSYGLIELQYTKFGDTATTTKPSHNQTASATTASSAAAGAADSDNSAPNAAPAEPALAGKLAPSLGDLIKSSLAGKSYKTTNIKGGAFAKDAYEDIPSAPGILVGFQYALGSMQNHPIVTTLVPIYLTTTGQSNGKPLGKSAATMQTIIAKPGYAISGIDAAGGGGLDSITIHFMAVSGNKLNPSDTYDSEKIGGPGGGKPKTLANDGHPIIGVVGKQDAKSDNIGLGLITLAP